MIGIGINIQQGGEEPPAYDADVQAWLDLITDKPSATQNDYVNTMIKDMKEGLGIERMSDWADVSYHLAAETAEASLKNMVKDAHHAVAVNSPVFTPLEGWQGDGISSYINTNYNASAHGINYKQDDAMYLNCINVAPVRTTNMYHMKTLGASPTFLQLRPAQNVSGGNINGNTSVVYSLGLAPSAGFWSLRRSSNTVYRSGLNKNYKNNSRDSGSLLSATFIICNSDAQDGLTIFGKYLSDNELNIVQDAFEALMDKNGKGVIP